MDLVGVEVCFTCVEGRVNEHTAGTRQHQKPLGKGKPSLLVLVSGCLHKETLSKLRCACVGTQGQHE